MRGCQKVQKFPAEFGSILAFFLNTRFYFIFDSRACNGGGAANPDLEYVRPKQFGTLLNKLIHIFTIRV